MTEKWAILGLVKHKRLAYIAPIANDDVELRTIPGRSVNINSSPGLLICLSVRPAISGDRED